MNHQQKVTATLTALLFFSSILFTGSLLHLPRKIKTSDGSVVGEKLEYSYKSEDYPMELPVMLPKTVEMTTEESIHFPVIGPEGKDEWLFNFPIGEGSFRFGPNYRSTTISIFHQFHCLRMARAAIAFKDYPLEDQRRHLEHCLNYLREMTLCAADTTLEPGDFTARDFNNQRTGATYMCRDFQKLYEITQSNWVEWYIYLKMHNILLSALREERLKKLGKQAPIA